VRAIEVRRNGGPEVLEYSDLASPKPKASEVLVRVAAAGVNFIDVYLREGRYPATCPFVLGQEGSGIVEQVGESVVDFRSGDRVAWAGIPGSSKDAARSRSRESQHFPFGAIRVRLRNRLPEANVPSASRGVR